MMNLQKNQHFQVHIDGYASDGSGVCRVDGRAVFVPKTIQGEDWEIRIVKVGANAVYGRGERLLSASPARVESACP